MLIALSKSPNYALVFFVSLFLFFLSLSFSLSISLSHWQPKSSKSLRKIKNGSIRGEDVANDNKRTRGVGDVTWWVTKETPLDSIHRSPFPSTCHNTGTVNEYWTVSARIFAHEWASISATVWQVLGRGESPLKWSQSTWFEIKMIWYFSFSFLVWDGLLFLFGCHLDVQLYRESDNKKKTRNACNLLVLKRFKCKTSLPIYVEG